MDIDSLHLTVVKGGAFGVGKWATQQGFLLPPDAPAVLDFYAQRSPYFMAVQFDAKKAAAPRREPRRRASRSTSS